MKFLVVIFSFMQLGCYLSPMRVAADFEFDPIRQSKLIGDAENKLIDKAFSGLDLTKVRDVHAHVVGVGHDHSGVELSNKLTSGLHVGHFIRYKIFLAASGVQGKEHFDSQYMKRLRNLITRGKLNFKHHILAFDRNYNEDGSINKEGTELFIPNEYVYSLAAENTDIFVPVISVHPYRKDAVERVNYWGKKGVRFMKWLPNAMGMNPSHKSLDEFYKALIKWEITLLTHAGSESSVDSGDNQKLGNPLLLRKPLDMGVQIIVAHGAASGDYEDLDNSGQMLPAYQFVLRLMNEKKYRGNLRIDISATLLRDRMDRVILDLLRRKDLHSRLVYGSDYPVPAVNVVIPLKKMQNAGFITKQQLAPLKNIYRVNPLLFNFVFYRLIKHPKTGDQFSAEAFYF